MIFIPIPAKITGIIYKAIESSEANNLSSIKDEDALLYHEVDETKIHSILYCSVHDAIPQ